MSFDLAKIIHEMGTFALAIGVVLLLMAVACGAIVAERLWAFYRAGQQSRIFGAIAARLVEHNELAKLPERAKEIHGSPLAKVLAAGVVAYQKGQGQKLSAAELARREMARQLEAVGADLRRGFGVLASVGSVAPFIGLLGTVVGIITAFEGIAKEGSGGLGVVSAGISEALVETALGLVVAIPTVMAFNYLSGKADAMLLALEQAKGEMVDHLESQEPVVPSSIPAPAERSKGGGVIGSESVHAA
jgi:biopolymer transport protein ExbB